MLVYDNSETTLFVSFVTEESSSKDVSSSTLVEGIPMWPVLHVNGPTSITSAITSISLTYTTENGIMSAPLVGMLREGCLFDWIFNGNITCEPQNTIVTLEFAFLDSSNSPLLRRVFPGFCSPPAAASATMPTITATSSPADCSNPDIVSCPMTNRQPFAVDTNFRTLTFMMEAFIRLHTLNYTDNDDSTDYDISDDHDHDGISDESDNGVGNKTTATMSTSPHR
uniref:Uncharacterized protein n=1 Tax=Plectus sambesii TaxID=2011161 RepID=A0A914UPQ5_9BILA